MTRREWVRFAAAVGVGTAAGCRQQNPVRIGDPVEGEITPSAVDYVTARRGFRTRLVRQGPSPEPAAMPDPLGVPGAAPVTYLSGGLQLLVWVNPEAKSPGARRPTVLFLHDNFAFGPADWERARPFLREGFHVAVPVARAENAQRGTFSLFYDEVDDYLATAEAVRNLPGVDAGKLFVCGHGTGGTMALLCALASDAFRACAAFSPWTSARDFLRGREALIPFDPSAAEEYQMRSPLPFAYHFPCPVRCFFGEDESKAQYDLAFEMGRHARGHLKNVGELMVPGDHETAVGHALVRTMGFFRDAMKT